MDTPIGVDVKCGTEICGRSNYLVINPLNDQVTHLVVAEKEFPNIERLVPISEIIESSPTMIRLRCSTSELSKMPPFIETDFISSGEVKSEVPYDAPYMLWPYSMYESAPMPLEYMRIPAGEVVIRRGAQVKAKDGSVGRVDEFLVDPKNNHISHLVMREGHLWGARDVTIPVSEIDEIDDEVVHLKLDKQAVASLPAIPVNRKWK